MGWLTTEELCWNDAGELQHPRALDLQDSRRPATGRRRRTCALLDDAPNREDTIHRSKAVGEPPLMLAISVLHAIRDAVASCGGGRNLPVLAAPATPESILRAIASVSQKQGERKVETAGAGA